MERKDGILSGCVLPLEQGHCLRVQEEKLWEPLRRDEKEGENYHQEENKQLGRLLQLCPGASSHRGVEAQVTDEVLCQEGAVVAEKAGHMPQHPELADKNGPSLVSGRPHSRSNHKAM